MPTVDSASVRLWFETKKYSFSLKLTLNIKDLKIRLRAKSALRRDAISDKRADEAASSIVKNFFTQWSPGLDQVVAGFWPIKSEINVRPLMESLYRSGIDIALPEIVAARKPLLFRKWMPGAKMTGGAYNTSILTQDAAIIEPNWFLVPLLAFDSDRYRLGYGGGFYDVTLRQLAKRREIFAVGVAYDMQEVQTVPKEKSDFQLDAILTEKRVILREG